MNIRCIVAIFPLVCPVAVAQNLGPTESVTVERYRADYVVHADGTYTERRELVVRVLSEEGVRIAGQAVLVFSESLQEAKILSAYTLKKNGKRIDVPAADIHTKDLLSLDAPVFSDIKLKAIVFPNVSPGDKVGYEVRITQKVPLYPGHFATIQNFRLARVYEDIRISVAVPVGALPLYADAVAIVGGRIEDQDGQAHWEWTAKDLTLPASGSGLSEPYVVVSSFKDYAAFAAAYRARAQPKAIVSAKIKALAEELTAGISEPALQARALYNWVSRNVRYVAVILGAGSVVPHEAEAVLANGYGDCKDHVTLLGALLAAKGIANSPALISAGGAFGLPKLPSEGTFNHVITYIPSLDVYVDSTARYAPFGVLPAFEADRPVLLISDSSLRKTPGTDSVTNRSHAKTILKIHEDGTADGETTLTVQGPLAIEVRKALAQMQSSEEDAFVRRNVVGQASFATLIKSDPQELNEQYTVSTKYKLANALKLPGPGFFTIPAGFQGPFPISARASRGASAPGWASIWPCAGSTLVEEYRIEFPKTVRIVSVPNDAHFTKGVVSYAAIYQLHDHTLIAVRGFGDHMQRNLCTPADLEAERDVTENVARGTREQISFEMSSSKPGSEPQSGPTAASAEKLGVDNPCKQFKVGDTWTFSVTQGTEAGKAPSKATVVEEITEITEKEIRLKVETTPPGKSEDEIIQMSTCERLDLGKQRAENLTVSSLSDDNAKWPLRSGREWKVEAIIRGGTLRDAKTKRHHKALGWEKVKVAGGEFMALRAIGAGTLDGYGNADSSRFHLTEEFTWWYSPQVRRTVKGEYRDNYGRTNERELVSYKLQ